MISSLYKIHCEYGNCKPFYYYNKFMCKCDFNLIKLKELLNSGNILFQNITRAYKSTVPMHRSNERRLFCMQDNQISILLSLSPSLSLSSGFCQFYEATG